MISLIIPVYNEEEIIDSLYKRCTESLIKIGKDFEIICVDDGSKDNTLNKLIEYHNKDKRFKILSLSRNFGHQSAVFAGLSYSNGNLIAIIDGDLQDPPEILNEFVNKIEKGYDAVYAVRKKRKEGFIKKTAYWFYYRALNKLSDTEIPLDSGDFCMMRKAVVDNILKMSEQSLFIRGIRAWVGFKQTKIEYERDSRQAGEPKYTLKKLFLLAYNGIFSFSRYPVKLLSRLGITIIFFTILYIFYILINKFYFGNVPKGFTTLIIFISMFSGIQLFALGIFGEYITRIYDETRKRPLFIVKEKFFE